MIIYNGKEYNSYTDLEYLDILLEGLGAEEKLKYLYNQKKRIKILMKYDKSDELMDYLTKVNMQIATIKYNLKEGDY